MKFNRLFYPCLVFAGIFLQGDHKGIEYRNLGLRPVVSE